jgi:pimeloyl-ACP methyl ester carboxylesterase
MMRQAEGTAAAVFAGSVRRFDGDAVLAALAVPVLVVTGSEDAFFTVASQRRIADAAQRGDLVVLDGVGHMSLWEAPAALARLLEDLIDRV